MAAALLAGVAMALDLRYKNSLPFGAMAIKYFVILLSSYALMQVNPAL